MKFMLLFVRTNTPLHIIKKKKKRVNPKKNNVNADGVPLHTRFADPSAPVPSKLIIGWRLHC